MKQQHFEKKNSNMTEKGVCPSFCLSKAIGQKLEEVSFDILMKIQHYDWTQNI